MRSITLLAAFAFALAACGGGGGEESPLDTGLTFRPADVHGDAARMVTGGSPLDLSAARAKAQQLAIVDSFDKGHITSLLTFEDEDGFKRFRLTCGSSCEGVRDHYSQSTFAPIMTKNGVPLARSSHRAEHSYDEGVDITIGYGGWMDHSIFSVQFVAETYDDDTYLFRVKAHGVALGVATGTNPVSGPLEWNGVMVGRNTDFQSAEASHVIQGDATISAEFGQVHGMSLDITFSGIKNLNNGASLADMTWSDVPVVNGSFNATSIEGSFYGSNHEEIAGVFERDQIIGAFGGSASGVGPGQN